VLSIAAPASLEGFFLEVGREPIEGGSEPVSPTPAEVQRFLEIVLRYGLEIRLPPM